MKRILAAVALVVAGACSRPATSTAPVTARVSSDPVVAESEVRRVLSILADDSMEGALRELVAAIAQPTSSPAR